MKVSNKQLMIGALMAGLVAGASVANANEAPKTEAPKGDAAQSCSDKGGSGCSDKSAAGEHKCQDHAKGEKSCKNTKKKKTK